MCLREMFESLKLNEGVFAKHTLSFHQEVHNNFSKNLYWLYYRSCDLIIRPYAAIFLAFGWFFASHKGA